MRNYRVNSENLQVNAPLTPVNSEETRVNSEETRVNAELIKHSFKHSLSKRLTEWLAGERKTLFHNELSRINDIINKATSLIRRHLNSIYTTSEQHLSSICTTSLIILIIPLTLKNYNTNSLPNFLLGGFKKNNFNKKKHPAHGQKLLLCHPQQLRPWCRVFMITVNNRNFSGKELTHG